MNSGPPMFRKRRNMRFAVIPVTPGPSPASPDGKRNPEEEALVLKEVADQGFLAS